MSCKSSPKKENLLNDILFPAPPSGVDENGFPVFRAAKSGIVEIWVSPEDTDIIEVIDFYVVPDWYMEKILIYIMDTEYAIDCLNLKVSGDP